MDVVCINRYYGWYNLSGDLDAACYGLNMELDFWEKQGKPVMITEYGADAVAGIHQCVPEMFSEEYQVEFYQRQNEEFDRRSFFIGEHVWNFADFAAFQGCMRVDGNKKGLLTRDRRPKMAAHYFRKRWGEIPDFNYK
jgi:beta-glucuronidase